MRKGVAILIRCCPLAQVCSPPLPARPLPAHPAVGQWLFVPGAMELASLFAEHFGTCRKYSLCSLA